MDLGALYLIFAGAGALLLTLSIFGGDADGDLDIGGEFDISDAEVGVDSPSIFSMKAIAAFLLAAGIGGFISLEQGANVWGSIFWGIASGFAIAVLYGFLMKFLYSMQGSSMADSTTMIGKEAIVTIPTTETGIAQVKLAANVGSQDYIAKEINGSKLKMNDTVKIVSSNAGTLTVELQQ